jgi:hypothetical protein
MCISLKLSFRYFEDLSNEIIYEIFEYLDAYDIYEGFRDLNRRFQNLLLTSTIPLKINHLFLSKSTFYRYFTHLITPNIHRIRSFRLSDPFISDLGSLLIQNTSKFTRLETLILDGIESIYLAILLHDLPSLPYLCSLTIAYNGSNSETDTIYPLIFQLPVLKYCKLSFKNGFGSNLMPTFDNKYSPIEYLIMKGNCNLELLAAFLSYTPQLRHLSIDYPSADYRDQTELFPIVLNHLTHASLRLDCIQFYQFVPLVRKLFQNLQVLRISTSYGLYLDAIQWERLIVSYMPCLRIFDLQYTDLVFNNTDSMIWCQDLMNGFTSPFWMERQWFFAHRHNWGRSSTRGILYSSKPFRRKHYIVSGKYDQHSCICNEENSFDAVRRIDIQNEEAMNNCSILFPNATGLTLSCEFCLTDNSLPTNLNRIVPLSQITLLNINRKNFPINLLDEILHLTPNCHTLTLDSILLNENNSILSIKMDDIRSIFKKDKLKRLTLQNGNMSTTVIILFFSYPQLEHLTISLSNQLLEPILRILLSETNRHLFSLCFTDMNSTHTKILKTLIDLNQLPYNCSLKIFSTSCELWW